MATFKELTGMTAVEDAEPQRPLETIGSGVNEETRRVDAVAQEQLREETSIGDTFSAAWQRNISTMLYDDVQRKFSHEPQEGFEIEAWLEENRESLPGVNMEAYAGVRSPAEAEELRADQIRALENDKTVASKGYGGVAAQILSGMVDPAELAIGVATGGSGKAVTMGKAFTRGAWQGTKGGLLASAAATEVDPLADNKQIIYGALTGALIGGPAGTAFNRSARAARDSYGDEVADLPPADTDHVDTPTFRQPVLIEEPDGVPMADNPQSLGAGKMVDDGMDAAHMTPQDMEVFDQARQFIRESGLAERMEDTDLNVDTAAGRTAKRFSDALSSDGMPDFLTTDFDRLQNGGTIEKALGYNLLESAEGRLRNNRSAAMLRENYEQRLQSHALPVLEDSYQGWAKKRDMGIIDRNKPQAREAFDREVIAELEARFHEGKPVSDDPIIKGAADAVDQNYADALTVAKGRDGETSVSGFEDIQQKSGFFNHRWSGAAIAKLEARGVKLARIEALLSKGYAAAHPDMDEATRSMVAKAVVRRARANADGIDTNMLTTLDSDGEEFFRTMMKDNGMKDEQLDNLIDAIRGKKEERSKLGTTKARTQVDLRTADGDFSLMDLVDTNLTRTLSKYNRDVAGNAALARKGIPNRQKRKELTQAALAERRARGMPADAKVREHLDNIWTYFDGGPIGQGVDPSVSRIKRITNLALLNQMGLTQTAETGAQIAAVGVDTWRKHAASVYKNMKAGSPMINELRPLMGRIGEDHMLFRDDLMLDELATTKDLNSFMGKLDFALGKGQRIQGYASGFFHVRGMQQKIAVASQADKVMQRIRDGVDEAELKDIGISPAQFKKVLKHVEFDADGYVDKLNIDKWGARDAEDFVLALHRHSAQVVQKAMAGEESMWMHSTTGSLLMHLKSFPLMAMRKQTTRTAGVSNPLLVATTTLGLATAAMMFDVKQVINGRAERVTPMETLKGAAAMSNITGWVPLVTDPAAAMLGMKDLQFSQYGRYDISNSVMAVPPVLTTMNKMLQAPGIVNPFSDLTRNERIRIAQTTPIVGNLYGFSAIFNAMKQ